MAEPRHPDVPLHVASKEQEAKIRDLEHDRDSSQQQEETIDKEAQAGVRNVEAIATVWSKTTLIIAYVLIWIVYFVTLMQQMSSASLTPFVTSAFQLHSLTPTVGIISTVAGGVCILTIAKVLDVFGRPQGYAVSLVITTIGLVMMAATNSVEMYAAAQVFWTVGTNSLLYTVNIIVADTSSLRNRALMTALTASPNIITIWLGGPISEGFLNGPGWRWAYGMFSIIVPVLCAPLLALLLVNLSKAKEQGVIVSEKEKRSPVASVLYYAREFDAVGLLLLTVGLSMFLLSFNLYGFQPLQWRSPLIICLLVFGVLLVVLFALWEKFLAPVTFIPYSLLLDRNMVGACVLGTTLFISFFCWNSFFTSYLMVVHDLSVTKASYVYQIYGLGGSLFSIATGVAIRYTGRFKAITLYGAIPVYVLFMGLMIHFRDAKSSNLGLIIMSQVFLSAAGGIMLITPQIAAVSASNHQNVAVVMAVLSMFSAVGGAVGLTVAGTIWQNVFPVKLAEYLPVEAQPELFNIYAMLEAQLMYPVGTPTRIAIQKAYADAQSMMLTGGTAVWVLAVVGVAIWRNTDVRTMKQVKGNVF
ncbi:hypothetical protein VDGE_09805 [Verticillium dahliae]|uniref:Major facilitator superfamily (MFS) profile domain-containing protein n=1 Tax=Verticillium dahliae TaxID=27337 RepID=A0A444RNR8_VERDA|nr:hypothetical protein VDGE_09805 [Verticillium dahliae]